MRDEHSSARCLLEVGLLLKPLFPGLEASAFKQLADLMNSN